MTTKGSPVPWLELIFSDSRKVSKFLAKKDPSKLLATELGDKFLDYRKRWDLARTFQEIPLFPLHVDYELKSECNLRCPMCPMATHKKSSGNQPELTASIVKALIDEGIKHGQASMGFGGLWEPLLSNDLTELIAYGRKKGLIEAMFNTNGLLLNDRLAEDLIDSGLTRIMISLDAVTAKTYKLMRPGSDLAQVEQNILTLLDKRKRAKSRLPLVRLSFCLTKINQSELLPFLERWNNVVDFFSVQTYGRFDDTSPLLFPNSSPMTLPTGHCAQPFKRLSVRHNGDVLPCCDLSGLSLTLGQAVHGLAQIWSSSKLFDLRASLKSPNFTDLPVACQSCQTKYLAPV